MFCPNPSCQSEQTKPELLMTERSGIEIDYCPRCRGIWLDRGELDRLLEKASQEVASQQPAPRATAQGERHHEHDRHDYDHDRKKYEHDKYKHYGHKRKSLLSELFDF
jgi:Zn-finger nucleic acid-binding protein